MKEVRALVSIGCINYDENAPSSSNAPSSVQNQQKVNQDSNSKSASPMEDVTLQSVTVDHEALAYYEVPNPVELVDDILDFYKDDEMYLDIKRQYILSADDEFVSVSNTKNSEIHQILRDGNVSYTVIDEIVKRYNTNHRDLSPLDSFSRERTQNKQESVFRPREVDQCSSFYYAFNKLNETHCSSCGGSRYDEQGNPVSKHLQLEIAPQLASLFKNETFAKQSKFFGLDCLPKIFKGDYLDKLTRRTKLLKGDHNRALGLFIDGFNPHEYSNDSMTILNLQIFNLPENESIDSFNGVVNTRV
uniref:Uncharacterized protein n=1 Tax=Choanephora cucurbitarum TaxID=101091 RepID=A0A1C7MGF6_9FUNG